MNARALAIVAALASFGAAGAQAQVYESAHLGAGHARFDCTGTSACDTGGTAFRLTGGYVVYDRIAVELGFINFGKAKATVPDPAIGDMDFEYKASAFTLGLAYQLPISQEWGANFRLGMANVTAKATVANAGIKFDLGDERKNKLYWGLGGNYAFSKNVMMELSADLSRANYNGNKVDLRAITLGGRYSF